MQRSQVWWMICALPLSRSRWHALHRSSCHLPTHIMSRYFCATQPPSNNTESMAGVLATTGTSQQEIDVYAPWEVRALLLSLLPPVNAGARPLPAKDALYLLPTVARKQLIAHEGGLIGYSLKHFPDDIIVEGSGLYRHSNSGAVSTTPAGSAVTRIDGEAAAPLPHPPVSPNSGVRGHSVHSDRLPSAHRGPKTVIELLDCIVEYIPTFFVNAKQIEDNLPSDIQRLYADTSFPFFIKRFKHYIDVRSAHGNTELRLRPDFAHPKRGEGDARYTSQLGMSLSSHLSSIRRPPRHSEANLIMTIITRFPREYTSLPTVLQDVTDIIARHPSFDPRLGVTGLLEKYPEYFQLADGKLRVRPYRCAPNSLDDLDRSTSPLPAVFIKLIERLEKAAEGANFAIASEKSMATLSTGKLYALLTAEEKLKVKSTCRSFPRFLRLHGKEIVVSSDNMRVHVFRPEHECCADTILDQRLAMSSISHDDPILKIPAEIDVAANADWAVKELYDALPLTQCAELAEILTLVSPSVRTALPPVEKDVVELLGSFPEYFLTWPFPDDPNVIVIQRAKVELPQFEKEEVARMVLPLIPQGGVSVERLLRRVPLPLQRYFYRHGLRVTLSEMKKYFLLSGDTLIRLG